MGHGSHVAGIVGADGKVTGVAPEVTFGAYRVFGCGENASSDTDVILQAMERAHADGMDVINMSLGASFETWPTYPTAVVADRLVDAGVVVVVSQGNEGTAGTFSSGAPAVAKKVISVGSVDNLEYMANYVTSAAGTEFPFMGATGAPDPTGGETLTLVAADPVLACEPVPDAAGPGLALLISRGTCSFHEKTLNAQNAGYEAALIYNNTSGVINMTVEGDTEITIPAVSLLQTDGAALAAEIVAGGGSTMIEFSAEPKRFPNPTGGYQSDFSSYGLAADLTLNPDVSAPGGSIYSTYPLEKGGHTTMGGTSMSAPHVAGAAALLLEARGDLAPLEVRRLLTNTADPFTWGTLRDPRYLEPVHRQGGGLIDIPQALTTATSVSPQKISLGEGEAGPVTTTITVSNSSAEAVTYQLGVANGIATGGATDAISFYAAYADVEFTANSVTVPAGGTATVQVRIGEDFGEDGIIYGGWVTLTSDADQLVIPFAGLSGDYQALTALDFAATAFADGEDLFPAEPFHTYSMVGNDVPYVALYLAYPVSNLYIDVYQAKADGTKGAKVHSNFINYAETLELGRLGDIATIAWDGTYQGNNGKNGKVRRVDNGSYVLELRVLKALGDPSNPAHWETMALDPVTIAYGDGADTGTGNGPKPKK